GQWPKGPLGSDELRGGGAQRRGVPPDQSVARLCAAAQRSQREAPLQERRRARACGDGAIRDAGGEAAQRDQRRGAVLRIERGSFVADSETCAGRVQGDPDVAARSRYLLASLRRREDRQRSEAGDMRRIVDRL